MCRFLDEGHLRVFNYADGLRFSQCCKGSIGSGDTYFCHSNLGGFLEKAREIKRRGCVKLDCDCRRPLETSDEWTPGILGMCLTSDCDLDCVYCCAKSYKPMGAWEEFEKKVMPTWEEFEKKVMPTIRTMYWGTGEFYHNEKYRDFFIKTGKKYGMTTQISTNLVNYNPAYKVDVIVVSLHGFDRESYIKNTRRDVFDKFRESLKSALKDGRVIRVDILMTVDACKRMKDLTAFIAENIPVSIPLFLRKIFTGLAGMDASEAGSLYSPILKRALREMGYKFWKDGV